MSLPINYITPRLGIILIDPTANLEGVLLHLRSVHGHYFHVFNLSSLNLDALGLQYSVPSTNFKWRDVPYSITEAIKILVSLEAFLRPNIANSAFFAVSTEECSQFCRFLLQAFFDLTCAKKGQICDREHLLG